MHLEKNYRENVNWMTKLIERDDFKKYSNKEKIYNLLSEFYFELKEYELSSEFSNKGFFVSLLVDI